MKNSTAPSKISCAHSLCESLILRDQNLSRLLFIFIHLLHHLLSLSFDLFLSLSHLLFLSLSLSHALSLILSSSLPLYLIILFHHSLFGLYHNLTTHFLFQWLHLCSFIFSTHICCFLSPPSSVVGKAAVRAEKASNPSLFAKRKLDVDRSMLSAKLSSEGSTALAAFKVRMWNICQKNQYFNGSFFMK